MKYAMFTISVILFMLPSTFLEYLVYLSCVCGANISFN